MTAYQRIYADTADGAGSGTSGTYAFSRTVTNAFNLTTANSTVGQVFSGGLYSCNQHLAVFDTSTVPAGVTAGTVSVSVTTAATTLTDTIEVRAVSGITNMVSGDAVGALTLYGSLAITAGIGRKNITLNITSMPHAASTQMLLHSQNQRTATAPTTATERIIFGNAETSGTTSDPYLETVGGWTFVGVSTVTEITTTTPTLTEPAGVADGDLLIACIASRSTATTAVTNTGWTQVNFQATNNTTASTSGIASGTMLYQIRAGTPDLTFVVPAGISVGLGRIIAYRGHATISPVDASTAQTTAAVTTAVSVTGLTTTQDDDLIVAMIAGGQEAAWSVFTNVTTPLTASGATDTTTAPSPTAWIERADSLTTTGADTSLAIFDAVRTGTGATGNLTATASVGGGNVVIAGAFKIFAAPLGDVDANAAGQSVTVSVGTSTVVGKANVSIADQQVAVSVGAATVQVRASPAVEGQALATAVDQVTVTAIQNTSTTVTGQALTAAVGAATVGTVASASADVAGQTLTTSVGTATATGRATASLTGQELAVSIGTATVEADASITVSGQQVTTSVGTATATGKASASVSGQELTAAVGTATAAGQASVTVAGQQLTTLAGTATTKAGVSTVAGDQQIAASVGTVTVTGKANVSIGGATAPTAGWVSTATDTLNRTTGQAWTEAGLSIGTDHPDRIVTLILWSSVVITTTPTLGGVSLTLVGTTAAGTARCYSVATQGTALEGATTATLSWSNNNATTAQRLVYNVFVSYPDDVTVVDFDVDTTATGTTGVTEDVAVKQGGAVFFFAIIGSPSTITPTWNGTDTLVEGAGANHSPEGTGQVTAGHILITEPDITTRDLTVTTVSGSKTTLVVSYGPAATGFQGLTASVGTATATGKATATLTGQELTTAVGTATVTSIQNISVNVTGQSVTTSVGDATVTAGGSVSVSVAGQAVTAAIGTATVTANQTVSTTLAGQSLAAAVGTTTATGKASTTVAGQVITVATGTASATGKATANVTGQAVIASVNPASVSIGAAAGTVGVWTGTAWAQKPVKVWNGSTWVQKPAKTWNGSSWAA